MCLLLWRRNLMVNGQAFFQTGQIIKFNAGRTHLKVIHYDKFPLEAVPFQETDWNANVAWVVPSRKENFPSWILDCFTLGWGRFLRPATCQIANGLEVCLRSSFCPLFVDTKTDWWWHLKQNEDEAKHFATWTCESKSSRSILDQG